MAPPDLEPPNLEPTANGSTIPTVLERALADFDPEVVDRVESALRGRVVDLGSGPGSAIDPGTSLRVQHHAADLVQVDLRPTRSPQSGRRVCANLERDLPFADAAFDAVVCNHVFEHLRNPDQLAAEIRRVLTARGVLITAVPNGRSVSDRLFRAFYRLHHNPKDPGYDPHYQKFTKAGFASMLGRHGFAVGGTADIGEGYSWLHKHPRLQRTLTRWTSRLRRRWNDPFLYGWLAIALPDAEPTGVDNPNTAE